MNFENQFLAGISRKNTDYIIHIIGDNQEYFDEILSLALLNKYPLSHRAAWVLEGCSANYPKLVQPHLGIIIEGLPAYNHPGTRRNILKILMRSSIPEEYEGFIADLCFEWVGSPIQPVATKVFCMEILANMLRKYPELKEELRAVIESQFELNSAAFKSKGRKVLKTIQKL